MERFLEEHHRECVYYRILILTRTHGEGKGKLERETVEGGRRHHRSY